MNGNFLKLGVFKLPSSKILHVWALEGDMDVAQLNSNLFTLEWPPHSGKLQEFPEVDDGAWFDLEQARIKINKGQIYLLDRLISVLQK